MDAALTACDISAMTADLSTLFKGAPGARRVREEEGGGCYEVEVMGIFITDHTHPCIP